MISVLGRRDTRDLALSPHTCIKKKSCEHTVRCWPPTNHEKNLQMRHILMIPWSWTSQYLEQNTLLLFKPPNLQYLLWQPRQTKTNDKHCSDFKQHRLLSLGSEFYIIRITPCVFFVWLLYFNTMRNASIFTRINKCFFYFQYAESFFFLLPWMVLNFLKRFSASRKKIIQFFPIVLTSHFLPPMRIALIDFQILAYSYISGVILV